MLLGSSLGFVIFSRMVFFDGLLTAFLTFSLLSFYLWQFQGETRWKLVFYGCLGGAVLAKGLLSLCLVGLITASFMAVTKGWKTIFRLFDPLGIFIFLCITIPWHLLASLQLSEFSWFYFINEHVLRFLDQRLPRDYYRGPFYYYFIRIPAYLLPWTLLLPFWGKKAIAVFADKPLRIFAWLWFLIPLAFFTLSRAKANYYMMIGIPPLSILLVEYGAHRLRFDLLLKIGTVVSGVFITVASFVVPRYETAISCNQAVQFLQKHPQGGAIYLYKRFEHISSFVFYYGKPIPILDSESADLAFGASLDRHKDSFLTWKEGRRRSPIFTCVVCPRDEVEFQQKTQGKSKLLYRDSGVLIYQVCEE
jgi:4-amino-4-deoxy-L-arabinose transferase-like glycosyltransferase